MEGSEEEAAEDRVCRGLVFEIGPEHIFVSCCEDGILSCAFEQSCVLGIWYAELPLLVYQTRFGHNGGYDTVHDGQEHGPLRGVPEVIGWEIWEGRTQRCREGWWRGHGEAHDGLEWVCFLTMSML